MPRSKEILEAALALDPAERARLVKEIIASLDSAAAEVAPDLASVIERRIERSIPEP